MSDQSIDKLRRAAKRLRKSYEAGNADAIARVTSIFPNQAEPLKHADFLHIIARFHEFESWPKLKFAVERDGLNRLELQRLLRHALFRGQHWKVSDLLSDTPDLPDGDLASQIALYDYSAVKTALEENPKLATRPLFEKYPIAHLSFSQHIKALPAKEKDMIAIAELLLSHGADLNEGFTVEGHIISALYGAIGHADNMVLAKWLLDHGADPNDGESLYHSTELGHHKGLQLLLDHGADPKGTNALLRALDFNDHTAVNMLLEAGAKVDEFNDEKVGGEAPEVIPALHQAARRMNDRAMIDLLLDAGADPTRLYDGVSAYAFAKVIGNHDLTEAIKARGLEKPLSKETQILTNAADGMAQKGIYLDPSKLPDCFRHLIKELITLPDKLFHIKRLVELGLAYDLPDQMGVTPVQLAGWNGLPEIMAYLLELGPDLSHTNNHGGTLLGTILHGVEHCPNKESRDHIECLRLALEHGVALPKQALKWTGDAELAAFLKEWAEDKPGQVV